MKEFLLVFAVACLFIGAARVVAMVWGETSELMIAVNGHAITLHGFWAELAAFPFLLGCLWLAWIIVRPTFQ